MRRPLLLVLLILCAAPAPAAARTGPCIPGADGPRCKVWSGKVTFVADGDTLDVAVAGDGRRRPARIRVTGIQAMEQTRYSRYKSRRRGDCHALAATARLERLIRRSRWRVRLAAQNPRSRSGSRLRRSVAVKVGGRWRDAARYLAAEGHALWLPNGVEWAWNRSFHDLTRAAAASGRGIWNPQACGAGPSAGADLDVDLRWDARGNDFDNVNGEWIEIENRSAQDVPLGGWWVRDSTLRRYTLPGWAVARAGDSVRVHVGSGRATQSELYWGLGAPVFENATYDERHMGDGAYLFDPDGDLRAWSTYP